MSARARSARRLASLLADDAHAHVSVQYDRNIRRYVVVWAGGADEQVVREAARSHADTFPLLDIDEFMWRRST